jgi:hypothetical protein
MTFRNVDVEQAPELLHSGVEERRRLNDTRSGDQRVKSAERLVHPGECRRGRRLVRDVGKDRDAARGSGHRYPSPLNRLCHVLYLPL